MKAIETIYNNYRFRSRLEARWAVFFDMLEIEYEYEKEGYDLDGICYLPDFWLPQLQCWIEIKGQEPTEEEHVKALKLASLSKYPVYTFVGNITLPDGDKPPTSAYKYHPAYVFEDSTTGEVIHRLIKCWAECPTCNKLLIGYNKSFVFKVRCACNTLVLLDSPRLISAYKAARQARFEHGERGLNKPEMPKKTKSPTPSEKSSLLTESYVPHQYKNKTFQTFNVVVPGVQDAFNQAINYMTNYENTWLVIGGNKLPVGKTHLAAAITNEFIKQNKNVCFAFPGDLLDQFASPRSNDVFEIAANTDLLVLDDYGCHNQEQGPQEKLRQLLVYRSENGLPTVLTTPSISIKLPTHPRTQIQIASLEQARDYFRY